MPAPESLLLPLAAVQGALPSSWGTGWVATLHTLVVSNVGLSGTIPADWELGNSLSTLQVLDLSNNSLSGNFLPLVNGSKVIKNLDISNNQLSGAVSNLALAGPGVKRIKISGNPGINGPLSKFTKHPQ